MDDESLERICFNCNSFFPDCDESTEYGICLADDAFEPFIDELFEMNYSSCRELVEAKKFLGSRDVCEKYEETEIEEMDENSFLGEVIAKYKETGEIDQELIRYAVLEEQLKSVDYKTLPVTPYLDDLHSGDPERQNRALHRLEFLIIQGNREAFEVLLDFLKNLPLPQKIEEVHRKIKILECLEHRRGDQRSKLIPLLIDELYQIPSNNTTRQWITKILKILARFPEGEVRQPLETLLQEREFSIRLRYRIEDVLYLLES